MDHEIDSFAFILFLQFISHAHTVNHEVYNCDTIFKTLVMILKKKSFNTSLIAILQSHGFGKHQIYKHILELSEPLNKRIG